MMSFGSWVNSFHGFHGCLWFPCLHGSQAGEATVETNSFQLFQLEGEELRCKGVVPVLWQTFGCPNFFEERDSV